MIERFANPMGYPKGVEGTTKSPRVNYSQGLLPFFILFHSLRFIPYSMDEITYRRVGMVVDNGRLFSLFLV
jgi:hypothetical protein